MTSNAKTMLAIERKNGPLRSVLVPSNALVPAVDSTQPFKSVVDRGVVGRMESRETKTMFRLFAAMFAVGTTEISLFGLNGFMDSSASGLDQAIALLVPLGTMGLSMWAMVTTQIRGSRRRKALNRHFGRALSKWLKERYQIEAPKDHYWQYLADRLMEKEEVGSRSHFQDATGKSFRLVLGEDGYFVEEVPELKESPSKDYTPQGTVAALTPAKAIEAKGVAADDGFETHRAELVELLSGDAQSLYSRTDSLLKTLGKRALSVESQHVIKRASEDLRQLLVLNRELHELGEVDSEAQSRLATGLSHLNDELFEVLTSERAMIKREIDAQVDYVKRRRRNPSNLTLPPNAPQIMQKDEVPA